MKNILNKYKSYLIFILIVFTTLFILSIINLFGIPTKLISTIIFIIVYFIYGFKKGKTSTNKGYIQGLKIGCILSLILFIFGIFNLSFSFKTLIYYSILILSSVFGSTIGINKKR